MQAVRFDLGAGSWQDIGLPAIPTARGGVGLARSPSGDLVVAWPAFFTQKPSNLIELATDSATTWNVEGVQRDSDSASFDPSIAFTPAGDTILAWYEQTVGGANPTYVDGIVAGTKNPLGSAVDPVATDILPYPSVAVDSAGTIYLAYAPTQPGDATTGVRVVKWAGTDWQNIGDVLPVHGVTSYPPFNLVIHPLTQQPVVATPYLDNGGRSAAGVWTFTGTAWQQVCGPLIEDTITASVQIDGNGRYIVAGQPIAGVNNGTTVVRRLTP